MAHRKISPESETNPPGKVDDSGLRHFAGYHLKRAYNVVSSDLTKTLEPLGLRITTYSSLVIIVDNPGIRQSEIAEALDIKRPNLVLILDDLEQRGWITRERISGDRRANGLFATLPGQQVCAKAIKLDQEHEAKILSSLNEKEIEVLKAALSKIEIIGDSEQ